MNGKRSSSEERSKIRNLPEGPLLRAARDGSLPAYGELVRRHQTALRQLLRRLCGNAADADDIAQEAFLRGWSRIDQIRQFEAFKPWLFKIALRTMADVQKSGRRSRMRDTSWFADQEQQGDDRETGLARMDVEHALAQLPDRERLVASLVFGAGFSHSDVSDMTGMPLGSVKTCTRRARDMLAQALALWGEGREAQS
jgi:RNA polymerase sigma factor, sigma-70 family